MLSWQTLHQMKCYHGSRCGSALCLVLPLQRVLILTHEESHLVPAEMDLLQFPAPPLACCCFSTPCKGNKFVVELIPPSLRNSTDPPIPPPWSVRKITATGCIPVKLPCFTEVFGCSFACCQTGARWGRVQNPNNTWVALRMSCNHSDQPNVLSTLQSRTWPDKKNKPAKG